MFEGDEEFYLTIDQSLSLNEITIGSPYRAVVNIFENESEFKHIAGFSWLHCIGSNKHMIQITHNLNNLHM